MHIGAIYTITIIAACVGFGSYFYQKMYSPIQKNYSIKKQSGEKTLVLVNAGKNQKTVLATLRQITGMDYQRAENIINSVPSTIMTNISEKEALLNKEALEFVGAEIEIK